MRRVARELDVTPARCTGTSPTSRNYSARWPIGCWLRHARIPSRPAGGCVSKWFAARCATPCCSPTPTAPNWCRPVSAAGQSRAVEQILGVLAEAAGEAGVDTAHRCRPPARCCTTSRAPPPTSSPAAVGTPPGPSCRSTSRCCPAILRPASPSACGCSPTGWPCSVSSAELGWGVVPGYARLEPGWNADSRSKPGNTGYLPTRGAQPTSTRSIRASPSHRRRPTTSALISADRSSITSSARATCSAVKRRPRVACGVQRPGAQCGKVPAQWRAGSGGRYRRAGPAGRPTPRSGAPASSSRHRRSPARRRRRAAGSARAAPTARRRRPEAIRSAASTVMWGRLVSDFTRNWLGNPASESRCHTRRIAASPSSSRSNSIECATTDRRPRPGRTPGN